MTAIIHSTSAKLFTLSSIFVFCFLLAAPSATAQSIFKKKEIEKKYNPNATPKPKPEILPSIVAPEGPTIPEEEKEEEEVAKPVTEENKVSAVLNRKRDVSANKSSPGVASLLGTAGQVDRLPIISYDPEEVRKKVEEEKRKKAEEAGDPLEERLKSDFLTREDARTNTITRPAPRGQILDRKGRPLAQNKVVHYAAIMFPQWGDDADEAAVLKYAADRISHVNNTLGVSWDLSPKVVRNHYYNRRWMPLLFSAALTKYESDRLRKARVEGMKLLPVYLRHYPNETMLAHVIGYVGKRPPRATGPISHEEPLWGAGKGVQGLEKAFDEYLTGTPGKFSELYDEDGNKLRVDEIAPPRPGNNIVTTLDIDAQRIAERLLRQRTNRSAMVVMDCNNGDVLAMASYPSFNPNDFVPAISVDRFKYLNSNPLKPLFGRAFQGSYPPASTYKVCSGLAFLEKGEITSWDTRPCPAKWSVGRLVMRNWNKSDEGDMNIVSAIARSCNTFFYEVAIYAGADAMSSMSTQLGLGEKTGIPVDGENAGFIPNNKYWVKNYRAKLADGDEANMSIGQGRVKATPIQIARMMAGIGNQKNVVQPRLVTQAQDVNHNVVEVFPAKIRNSLNVRPESIKPIREGMYNVVNSSYGTGKAGWHKVSVAAKTGTGQWIANRNIAWFAGYFPARNPVYSFAIVYEGEPYEQVSGGKKAAPIIKSFMDEYLYPANLNDVRRRSAAIRGDYYEPAEYIEKPKEESKPAAATTKKPATNQEPIFKQKPQAAPQQPSRPSQSSPRRRNLFDRLFKGRR